jgi:hypothetical protein
MYQQHNASQLPITCHTQSMRGRLHSYVGHFDFGELCYRVPPTWITKLWSWIFPACCALSISLMAYTVPRPVAASRPKLPCRCTGCTAIKQQQQQVARGESASSAACSVSAVPRPVAASRS